MKICNILAAMTFPALVAVFLFACADPQTDTQTTLAVSTEAPAPQTTEIPITWAEAESFSAPEAMPEPTPQKTVGKDKAPDTSYALERIEAAHAVYDLFIGAKPKMDKADKIVYENELEYYRVADPEINTLDKLRAYVSRFFSEKITNSLMSVELYVETEDGKLYVPDVGMQTTPGTILAKKVEITEKTDTAEEYLLTLTIDGNGDGKADSEQTCKFTCEPVGEKGSWVFTHYEMY